MIIEMTSMTTTRVQEVEKLQQLRDENNLLNTELNTYKQLFCLLSERHSETVKYIQILKDINNKLLKKLNQNENNFNKLEEINCENKLLKFNKQIDSLQELMFSSLTKTVETQTNPQIDHQMGSKASSERAIIKFNNKTIVNNYNNNTPNNSGKYRCEYFGCNQLFSRKDQMESHLRIHNSMQSAISYEHNQSCSPFESNFDKNKDNSNSNESHKISEIIFVPQMELEVIEYSNAGNNSDNNNANESLSYINTSDDSNSNRCEKTLIACDICGKQFSKHYIQSHRRSHTGVKPYKCSFTGCERTFTQTSSRNYHEKTYHRIDKYSLRCYYNNCQKSFARQIDLQKHLSQHNSNSHNYNTSSHDMQFIKVNKSRKLRRVPHRSGKHACNQCGKTFAHKVALRQHQVIHGKKQFICSFADCEYASYWKQNLSLHLRRHHNQE